MIQRALSEKAERRRCVANVTIAGTTRSTDTPRAERRRRARFASRSAPDHLRDFIEEPDHLALVRQEKIGGAPRLGIDAHRQHRRQLEPEDVLVGDIIADIERALASGMSKQRAQRIALVWRFARYQVKHAVAVDQPRQRNKSRRAFLHQPKRGLAWLCLPIVKCYGIGFVLERNAGGRAPRLVVSTELFEPFAAVTR